MFFFVFKHTKPQGNARNDKSRWLYSVSLRCDNKPYLQTILNANDYEQDS